jgi:hypothetical protein
VLRVFFTPLLTELMSGSTPLIDWVYPRVLLAFAATVGAGFFVVGQVGTWRASELGPYPEVGFATLGLVWVAIGVFAMTFDETRPGERARFAVVLGGSVATPPSVRSPSSAWVVSGCCPSTSSCSRS